MPTQPLISVIIPVYNGEKYVKSCLENVLNQTCKSLEIIVVNDGSTDNSAQIAKSFPVHLINLEKNQGLSAARNTGMDAANGRYIHFIDVDDAINNQFYEELAAAIVETGADIACAGMMNEKRYYKSMFFKKRKVYEGTYEKLKVTYVGKLGYVWRYLFELEFLRKHNLRFEENRLMEDLMFSLPAVYYAKKLVVVPGAVYEYLHRENSIMTNSNIEHKKKRRADWTHTKAYRREFARKHNLKIPGVNTDVLDYIFKKIYRKYGYKLFGKSFIK